MYEKRGDLGELVAEESSQYDILIVTRPAYSALGKKIPSTYPRKIANNLVEGSEMLSSNKYLAVITDDSAIARKAAEKRIPFVLLQNSPSQSHKLLAERNPHSYCFDPTKRGFISEFRLSVDEILSSYVQPQPKEEQASSAYKVLVVEDDPMSLKLTKQTLEDKGYQVKTADNVKDAIAVAQQEGIDVVVTDLELQDSSSGGLHILQMVKFDNPTTPVIIHTGYKSGKIHETVKACGVYDVLVKSADSQEKLIVMIAEALGLKKSEEQGLSLTPFSDGTEDRIVERLKEEDPTRRFMEKFERSSKEELEEDPIYTP